MYTFIIRIITIKIFCLWAISINFAWTQALDKVVAIVNDQVITQNEFSQRFELIKSQLAEDQIQLSELQLTNQVMQTLIQEAVVMQYAQNAGFAPGTQRINSVLQQQAKSENITVEEVKQNLIKQGISASTIKQQIAMQMIISYVRENIINTLIKVNSVEVDAYLSDKLGTDVANQSAEVNVAHIVFKVPENANKKIKEQTYLKALEVLSQAQSGAEFSDLAARYSDFSDANQGGILGYRPQNRLPTIYEEYLVKMNNGDISEILTSPNGYHIIKLIDRRHNTLQEVERIRASHILIRPKSGFSEDKSLQEILELHQRIQQGEDFAAIAANYSQDTGADKNGDLGWLYPGDTVGSFESTMANLKTGEISEPVRTSFGWHLIKVTGREIVPLPVNKARQLATRALVEEKSANAFNNWINELIAKSYIKIIN